MARADEILALIQSHTQRDDARFEAGVRSIAANAQANGQTRFAADLRRLLERAFPDMRARPLLDPKLEGLVAAFEPPALRLSDLIGAPPPLHRVLQEQRERERLQTFGLSPARRLLLAGPPGTGKTMTASVLAGELGLPLFVMRLDGLFSQFLGQSAARLRLFFDAMASHHGVYLLDEFDAIGTERGRGDDVGEARRLVNSTLQLIEQDRSESLILAATNLPDTLDGAFHRRFDIHVRYELPTVNEVSDLIVERLLPIAGAGADDVHERGRHLVSLGRAAVAGRLSHAEVVSACEGAAKDVVLRQGPVTLGALLDALGAIFDQAQEVLAPAAQ